MIVIDAPIDWGKGFGPTSHLMSDLPGEAGSKELSAFASAAGLNPAWLQKAGTAYEHYDIMKGRHRTVRQMGAREVGRKEFVQIIKAKKAAAAAQAPTAPVPAASTGGKDSKA